MTTQNTEDKSTQDFAIKQKILFSYHIKKILLYFFLILLLLFFGKILLNIADIFSPSFFMRPNYLIPPMFPQPPSPIVKKFPESKPIKADVSQICIADYKNGTHPGMIIHNNCAIAYGSDAITIPHYKKLTEGKYNWVSFNYEINRIPENAVIGGQEPINDSISQNNNPYQTTRNLYICRIPNGNYIGKIVDGVCNYTVGKKSQQADEFEVLVK